MSAARLLRRMGERARAHARAHARALEPTGAAGIELEALEPTGAAGAAPAPAPELIDGEAP